MSRSLSSSDQNWLEQLAEGHLRPEASEILAKAVRLFPGRIALANSFGLEDLVLQHLALPYRNEIRSFVLDTGRLPPETYDLIERWRIRFDLSFQILAPEAKALEDYVSQEGPNAFYQSLELRRRCCAIRKLEPLERALKGQGAWLTGLRREQSQARSALQLAEREANGRWKLNPLAHWSLEQIWDYVRTHDLPYSPLHDRGYPSIGCAPCTRAIAPGEDIRAGRWWWELDQHKECGLHTHTRKETAHAHQSTR